MVSGELKQWKGKEDSSQPRRRQNHIVVCLKGHLSFLHLFELKFILLPLQDGLGLRSRGISIDLDHKYQTIAFIANFRPY